MDSGNELPGNFAMKTVYVFTIPVHLILHPCRRPISVALLAVEHVVLLSSSETDFRIERGKWLAISLPLCLVDALGIVGDDVVFVLEVWCLLVSLASMDEQPQDSANWICTFGYFSSTEFINFI
ncbi:hypothetical protein Tco_0379518 [Tanacetum coccineum]